MKHELFTLKDHTGNSARGFRCDASGGKATIYLYDVIGEDMFGGVSAKQIADALTDDIEHVTLRINSPGGDVFDGVAMYNLLAQHKADVTVYIDGLAASAASLVAMAGDKIIIAENAQMMIHKAWTLAIGNADELRGVADLLGGVDKTLLATYAARTGRDADEIGKWMADEKWMNGAEAVELGFADEQAEAKRLAASVRNGAELGWRAELHDSSKTEDALAENRRRAASAARRSNLLAHRQRLNELLRDRPNG